MAWLLLHITDIIAIVTGVVSTAALVAALTPTPADDSAIAWIRKLIDVLALNIGHAKNQ